jgi:hypothetical protein
MKREMNAQERWEAERKELSARHAPGARVALKEAMHGNCDVECMRYCYGGTAKPDLTEILAELAEHGWRLEQVA